jgi:hypothetical protein
VRERRVRLQRALTSATFARPLVSYSRNSRSKASSLSTPSRRGEWWPNEFDLPVAAWDRYGRVLAIQLADDNDWGNLPVGYAVAKSVNVERAARRARPNADTMDHEDYRRVRAA